MNKNAGLKTIRGGVVLLVVLLATTSLYAYDIDTTKVRRQPVEAKKSFGEKLLAAPQFLLDLPLTATGAAVDFTVNDLVLSSTGRKVTSLFSAVDRHWGFAPVGGYGTNAGYKLGLGFWSEGVITKGERFQVKGYYSTNDYQRYKIRYAAPNRLGVFKRLFVLFDYKKRPRESFYGLGPNTKISDRISYTWERFEIATGWYDQLHPTTKLDIQASFLDCNIFDGRTPDIEGRLPVIQEQFALSDLEIGASRVLAVGGALSHDWRNNPGQPSAGGYESVSLYYNHGVDRSDGLKYLSSRVSLHYYVNIYRKRLLAFHALAKLTDRLDNSPELPFYLRPSLGGEEDLRAYRSSRYVDHSATMLSVEYRWPIWDVIDAFIFVDEGRVFDAISEEFTLKNWQYSAGGGLRVWQQEGLLFSMLLGTGREGTRFYLQVSEEL